MGSSNIHCSLFVFLLLILRTPSVRAEGTSVGFYDSSCPQAESVVRSTVQDHFNTDPTIAPGLLRMHFHDCFVKGCDGSILINGPSAEKNALPNLNLKGFEVIDDAKAQLEVVCPGVVSCADILALAARDSVDMTGGPSWAVPTGRRDGLVSSTTDADNLPSFTDSIEAQRQKFLEKGLSMQDLVTLVGAHTIGTTACQFIRYRLYNFTSDGGPDPSINPSFLPRLQAICPSDGDGSRRVSLDTGSEGEFDLSYYANLKNGRGVLESDQKLWTDPSTRVFVQRYTGLVGGLLGFFDNAFSRSMVKLSNVEVLTGSLGEIRSICSAFNS
ncbi:Peroxidase N1 [Acorus calamus]|uniref:Peroxidase n=1 Tax=Acorus calamus TaxID=4465 RepID=A0AAV9DPR6_ACOCL|nr:Peroxidase N1 [Acorus calamus]